MSALGHKQTCDDPRAMSALHPKATQQRTYLPPEHGLIRAAVCHRRQGKKKAPPKRG